MQLAVKSHCTANGKLSRGPSAAKPPSGESPPPTSPPHDFPPGTPRSARWRESHLASRWELSPSSPPPAVVSTPVTVTVCAAFPLAPPPHEAHVRSLPRADPSRTGRSTEAKRQPCSLAALAGGGRGCRPPGKAWQGHRRWEPLVAKSTKKGQGTDSQKRGFEGTHGFRCRCPHRAGAPGCGEL